MTSLLSKDELINELESSTKTFQSLATDMLKADDGNLFHMDLFAIGIINRSLLLKSGFLTLIKEKNFLSAAPLIRLYLDTLLLLFASFIVPNPSDFVEKIMEGKETRTLKDLEGNKMSDSYLAKKLAENKEFKWAKKVYNETSGFIHFSDKHIFTTAKKINPKDYSITFSMGETMEIPIEAEIEALYTMKAITFGLLKYIHGWVYTKEHPELTNLYKEKTRSHTYSPSLRSREN